MKYITIYYVIIINLKILFLKIIKSKNIKPYKILINLTDLCNSRCEYCDIWKIKPKNEIILDDIKKSLFSIRNDIVWMSFSGGEVSLVNYYFELLDWLKVNCKNLKILAFTTNALAPEKIYKYAIYSKEKGFDTLITISLDGDEKTHDEIRGIKGNYKKCEELYSKLKNSGVICHYGITLSAKNNNFVIKKYNEYKNKIKAITFVHSEGIYNKKNSFTDDPRILTSLKFIYKNFEVKKIYEFIEKLHLKISIKFLEKKRTKNIIPCDVINTSLHIMANGDVKPCMFMNSLGNIKNDTVKNICFSKNSTEAKKIIKENNCPKCWMNCYSPHSIMQSPVKSILNFLF
jgi:MoaA/NifB/PqqE/SkfB family radical SAM enzyme